MSPILRNARIDVKSGLPTEAQGTATGLSREREADEVRNQR